MSTAADLCIGARPPRSDCKFLCNLFVCLRIKQNKVRLQIIVSTNQNVKTLYEAKRLETPRPVPFVLYFGCGGFMPLRSVDPRLINF